MSYSDHFLTNLFDKIIDRLEKAGRYNNGKFLSGDYNRIEREEMASKIDELWNELETIKKEKPQ